MRPHGQIVRYNPFPRDIGRWETLVVPVEKRVNPLTGKMMLEPQLRDSIPEGFTVIERTPPRHVAGIGRSATAPMVLTLRQRLASLEPLRPLPLIKISSMQQQKQVADSDKQSKHESLLGSCSTRGAPIASNDRCFHIMDSSIHPLLSPSTLTTRLVSLKRLGSKRSR